MLRTIVLSLQCRSHTYLCLLGLPTHTLPTRSHKQNERVKTVSHSSPHTETTDASVDVHWLSLPSTFIFLTLAKCQIQVLWKSPPK